MAIREIEKANFYNVRNFICLPDDVSSLSDIECGAGSQALVVDTGVMKLYIYNGDAWVDVTEVS